MPGRDQSGYGGQESGADRGMGRGGRRGRVIKLLLVTPTRNSFRSFAAALDTDDDVALSWAESGKKALAESSKTLYDLVVIDETLGDMTGLELAEKMLYVNPMINCAAVSMLSSKDFHEVSEGLGLLAQLPKNPDREHAENLLERIKNIKGRLAEI